MSPVKAKRRGARRSILRSAGRRSSGGRVASRVRSAPGGAPFARRDDLSALLAAVQHLTVDCARLAAGYGTCAKRARDVDVADLAGSLSTLHRAVAEELAAFLVTSGSSVPRTKTTCSERLRWEWLASTGRLMNGAPERQLLDECARIEQGAEDHVVALRDEASTRGLDDLRQLVSLLERGRAASVRLEGRTSNTSTAFTFG